MCTRKNNSVFRKTVLTHISNTRKGIVLQGRPILLVLIINKYYGKTPITYCLKDKKIGWKKERENIFSFLFSVVIGGYRTLLVMNSVNPLLIPLRYVNHA